MSREDIQWWSFVIGLLVFVSVIGMVYLRRRLRGPNAPITADRWSNVPSDSAVGPEPDQAPRRRRPAAPPPADTPQERRSAVRSLLLRAAAERAPAGWSVLVLTPPARAGAMTWHLHLAPLLALDVHDGRTVPAAAPAPSHEWTLASGRTVGVGDGEIDPPPSPDTAAVRVTGPYVVVTVEENAGGSDERATVTARVVTTGDTLPEPRAPLTDTRAVQAALREAVELAVGTRMGGSPPALGYRPAAWAGHERTWLTISR